MGQFPVTDKAMRPGSPERRCFYCHEAVGAEHKLACVLIHKKVLLRVTIEYFAEVPANWDKETIEDHRNYSTWCADNMLSELQSLTSEDKCLCDRAQFEVLREDEELYLRED